MTIEKTIEDAESMQAKIERLTAELDELVIKNKRQEDIICVLMNADETGYVDGEGFVIGFNQITDEAKAMLAKRDLEMKEKGVEELRGSTGFWNLSNCKMRTYVRSFEKYLRDQLTN